MSASRAPWRLGDPAPWRLGNPSPRRPGRDWLSVHDYLAPEPITLAVETRRDVIRDRFSDTTEMLFRAAGDGGGVLAGRMMPYGEWTEVNSLKEGHFLERFAPGALAGNAIPAMAKRIRVLFEHGLDTVLGRQAIAAIEEMRDEPDGAYYRARLLDGLPELLVAGLRRGPYGSSVRFEPLKQDRVRYPKRSEYNPEGLPEHTVREARIREFSVVTFPQYAGATA